MFNFFGLLNRRLNFRSTWPFLILGLMMLLSSKPQIDLQQKKDLDPDELEVLKQIVLTDTVPTIFYRTTVSDLNQPLARHLFYLKNFEICTSLMNLDSARLTDEEHAYIVNRFETMEQANINKLVKEPKNFTVKTNEDPYSYIISMPVVFREGKYAIYYAKGTYGGQFLLMKKVKYQWINVCSTTVWAG